VSRFTLQNVGQMTN